ncbi:MAG TPA: type II secretion system minor pseudopilin GspJ [Steroidobacteraceae bacterium]|jgi:general secretion pathway protein J|nr:type II secretion system minor pseudopilin GspJ [Steroidobacteraceae bacterium]
MSLRTSPRPRGFTLIELLVALFITAIMFAIGYGELNEALKSRQEVEQQSARMLAIQHAVRTIEQDFELLQPRPVRNLVGDGYLPALIAGSAAGGALISGGGSSGPGTPVPLVIFTRGGWTNPIGLQRSELQRVAYAVQNGTLVRQYWPVLDATLEDTVVSRVLLDHVKGFSLRFMDAGHQWQTQWPATALVPGQQNVLLRSRPIAVEVTLDLDDWGVLVRDIEVAG